LIEQKRLTEACVLQYFEKKAMKPNRSNLHNWKSAFYYFKDFLQGETFQFAQLNESVGEDFKEYLLSTPSRKSVNQNLSINSAKSYCKYP
jgi:hypothetical protein